MDREGDAVRDAHRRARGFLAIGLAAVIGLSACSSTSESPAASLAGQPSTGELPASGGATPTPSPSVIVGGGGAGGDASRAAFSDAHPFHLAVWESLATSAEALHCSTPRAEAVGMDREAAIAATRAFLDREAGAGSMADFDASPDAASAETASAAAAAAALSGNPAGAVAALLAAARHEPDDARHLVNLAGILPDLGLSSEALAMLEAAAGMDEPTSMPYGIDQRAVHRNNEGRALLGLGQWSEAASVLEEAYELDPTLTEAAANLSLALLCTGDRDGARRFARASRHREQPRTTQRDGSETPVPKDVFDFSNPLEPEGPLVPDIILPPSPRDGVGMSRSLTASKQEILDRMISQATSGAELQAAVNTANLSPMTRSRNDDIMLAISALNTEGGLLADERQAIVDASTEAFEVWDRHFGPAGAVEQLSNACSGDGDFDACMRADCIPDTASAHASWYGLASILERAVSDWADAYYPVATSIAGHIGNETQYELAMLAIQGQIDQALLDLVSTGEMFAMSEEHNRDLCVEGLAPEPDPLALGDAPAGEPCTMDMGDWSIVIAGVTISVHCSDWSLEASTPGPIGVFVQVGSKGGETTVFAGPTASTSVGPFSAGSRSGFYVRSGPSGASDFGYRVEPGSTSIGSGPISVSGPSMESMDFSFVGISASMPGF